MNIGSTLQRLRSSFKNSAGTIVFGMEDGTVSIFGLIFGVAATTTDTKTVLIAGATGAVAAAVSMMAGVYLDAETTRDETAAIRSSYPAVPIASRKPVSPQNNPTPSPLRYKTIPPPRFGSCGPCRAPRECR